MLFRSPVMNYTRVILHRSRLRRDCSGTSLKLLNMDLSVFLLFLQRFATIKLKIHIYTMQLRKFIPRAHQPLWSSQYPIRFIVSVECQLYRVINQLTDAQSLVTTTKFLSHDNLIVRFIYSEGSISRDHRVSVASYRLTSETTSPIMYASASETRWINTNGDLALVLGGSLQRSSLISRPE